MVISKMLYIFEISIKFRVDWYIMRDILKNFILTIFIEVVALIFFSDVFMAFLHKIKNPQKNSKKVQKWNTLVLVCVVSLTVSVYVCVCVCVCVCVWIVSISVPGWECVGVRDESKQTYFHILARSHSHYISTHFPGRTSLRLLYSNKKLYSPDRHVMEAAPTPIHRGHGGLDPLHFQKTVNYFNWKMEIFRLVPPSPKRQKSWCPWRRACMKWWRGAFPKFWPAPLKGRVYV